MSFALQVLDFMFSNAFNLINLFVGIAIIFIQFSQNKKLSYLNPYNELKAQIILENFNDFCNILPKIYCYMEDIANNVHGISSYYQNEGNFSAKARALRKYEPKIGNSIFELNNHLNSLDKFTNNLLIFDTVSFDKYTTLWKYILDPNNAKESHQYFDSFKDHLLDFASAFSKNFSNNQKVSENIFWLLNLEKGIVYQDTLEWHD